MAYIGKSPTIGNFQKCDAITVVNGQAAYTMQVGGTNVSPESENHMLVSLNGILQAPVDSFTISGSTITFASNLATGDVIDFIMLLGNVLDLGVPSDNTVTAAKLNNDIISGQTALTSAPADTDEFLISDAGTIKRIDYSLIKASPAIELITSGSYSSDVSSISIDGHFTSTYRNYKFILDNVHLSADNININLRYNQGGTEVSTAKYANTFRRNGVDLSSGGGQNTDFHDENRSSIQLTNDSSDTTAQTYSIELNLFDPLSTTIYKLCTFHNIGVDGDNQNLHTQMGGGMFWNNTTAVSGITLLGGGGNFKSFNYALYGIKG